jgi:pectin methylesterase-like acyl-CoA thioesterase
MYQRSVVRFCGLVLVAFLSLLAGCSRQVPSGELGSSAVIYYVKPGGSNSLSGTSLANAWASINYAVNFSGLSAGDTIKVQPGTYNEIVTITKSGTQGNPITLLGDGTYGTIILQPTVAGQNSYNKGAIMLRPSNLTDSNAYVRDWIVRGFRINGCANIDVGNCQAGTVKPNIWAGILVNRVNGLPFIKIILIKQGHQE